MSEIEILAPCGSKDALTAAVRSGADAVYLGTGAFNARRNADNFGEGALKEAVNYCHGRGVKVYVTLNTLIRDEERAAFRENALEVSESGPDAIIVQDLGAAAILREVCPKLPLCGSTQMSVHNPAGAAALEKMGFQRVVLARELTFQEIKKIRESTSIELEVFIHGALCMSVSGMCYLSAMLGERSGNRGLCAQPCRLAFVCNDRPYALSLKDMSLVEHVEELREAGVCSVKIEGRMKRPEYVAAAVTAVRKALQGDKPDMESLRSVFSRSGFTDGYFIGKRDVSLFGVRTEADAQKSKTVFGKMAELYRRERQSVPVSMALTQQGDELILKVSDGKNEACAKEAVKIETESPLTEEIAKRQLEKTGGTPFFLQEEKISISPRLMALGSGVGALRREALEKLLAIRSRGIEYPILWGEEQPETPYRPGPRALRLRFETLEQLFAPREAEALLLPVGELLKKPELLQTYSDLWAELPALCWPLGEEKLKASLALLKDKGLVHVTAGNIGMLTLAREMGFTVHGEQGLNITNSRALGEYEKLGLKDTLLSMELTLNRASSMGGKIKRGVLLYGRLPLMQLRGCPAKGKNGCGACTGRPVVTDRLNKTFPLICHERQYTTLHNAVPLYLGDKQIPGFDFGELYFTVEEPAECREITTAFLEGTAPWFERTNGLAFRTLK